MELGIIGLGRMGGNMARRLLRDGHKIVAYNRSSKETELLAVDGGIGAKSIAELVSLLTPPRTIWMMIPSGAPVDDTIALLLPLISKGDLVIDGGNSNYKDTVRRSKEVTSKGYSYMDVGTSGGIWGLKEGYSMMIGGDPGDVERIRPIFESLAPGKNSGWGHVGPHGAGHFVKMIHNGIEYGMMQAYAEGFSILDSKKEFNLDLHQISEIWRHGSVVRSWLLDLTANVFANDTKLNSIEPYVADSGEGRWTVAEAMELDVPAPVITLSLIQRFRSRDGRSFADRILAAMRNQFGGHAMKTEPKK